MSASLPRLPRRDAIAGVISVVVMQFAAVAAEPLPTQIPPGTKLVVADQNEQLQVLIRASGEQQKLGATVSFANFQGGPAILEAFRAGALDLAVVGNTPPIQAHAAGEVLPIVAVRTKSGPDYHFAVRPGLTVNTLQEFKGKKIAYAEGTGRQPFVLSALKAAGLTTKDVKLIPLRAGEFPTAVQSGQVDLASLTEPHFSRYLRTFADQKASALPSSEHLKLPTNTSYLYASPKALKDPAKVAAIRDFIEHWVVANYWSTKNQKAWVDAYYVKNQGLKEAEGLAIVAAEGVIRFPRLSELIPQQQATIDLILGAGDIPKRLNAAEEFDLRFEPVVTDLVAKIAKE
jgi:sulfonate transport system substrate-binding protein